VPNTDISGPFGPGTVGGVLRGSELFHRRFDGATARTGQPLALFLIRKLAFSILLIIAFSSILILARALNLIQVDLIKL